MEKGESSRNGARTIRQSYAKTVISTTTCHKQKLLKRIKDLNVKTKTNNSRCLNIRKRL